MKIFMTGATGVVGRRAVPRLIEQGHAVAGVARCAEKAEMLETVGAQAVMIDLFDHDAVMKTVRGFDAICNLATSIPSGITAALPFAWSENDRIRRDVSHNLVDAAFENGIKRFVQESFALIYPDSGDVWIDETKAPQPAGYVRSMLDAEKQILRFNEAGGSGAILRFGLFYGSDSSHTLDMIRFTRMGIAFGFGSPNGFISSLSTDDAAGAVAAALEVTPGIYNAVDDEPVTKRAYFDLLADAIAVPSPKFPPSFVRYLLGSMGETLSRSLRISNRKLKETGAWQPIYPSVQQGFSAIVKQIGA